VKPEKKIKEKKKKSLTIWYMHRKTDGQDPKRHRLCPVMRIVLMLQSMNA
jgi:hypothetical protein